MIVVFVVARVENICSQYSLIVGTTEILYKDRIITVSNLDQ